MRLAENVALVGVISCSVFIHLFPVPDQLFFHGRTNSELLGAVLVVALDADALLFGEGAVLVLARRPDRALHFGLCRICEVELGQPVDAAYVHPAYIGLDNSARVVVVHDALRIVIRLLHQRRASETIPFVRGRHPAHQIMPITLHVHCHLALVANHQVVPRFLILDVVLTNIAHDVVLDVICVAPDSRYPGFLPFELPLVLHL